MKEGEGEGEGEGKTNNTLALLVADCSGKLRA